MRAFILRYLAAAAAFVCLAAMDAPPLTYETLVEPTQGGARSDAAVQRYRTNPSDKTLLPAIRRLLRIGDADDAWDIVEAHPPSDAKAVFTARRDAINANLERAGGLGKLKWAKRLRAHCTARTTLAPADEDAQECLVKFHNRAPRIAGGDKDAGQAALEALRRLNSPRAALVEAELIFREDPDRAKALVDDALNHENVYAPGLMQAALVYGYFKDWDKASEALARVPDTSDVAELRHYQMGKLCAEMGKKLEEGEQALLTFLSGDTRFTGVDFRGPAHWRLGQIFVQTQRYALAERAFETALDYNPRFKPAKRDLKALKKQMKNQG